MLNQATIYSVVRSSFDVWPREWPNVRTLRGFFTGQTMELPYGGGTLYEFDPLDAPKYYLRKSLFIE